MPRPDGAVGMWAIQAPDRRTIESAGKDCPHFHGPTPKRIIYEKAPQGCCGMESAEPGPAADSGECGKRGQSGPRTRNPNAAQIRIVHRFPCSPRRREPKAPVRKCNADKRKCGKNVGNPGPKPETRKQRK